MLWLLAIGAIAYSTITGAIRVTITWDGKTVFTTWKGE